MNNSKMMKPKKLIISFAITFVISVISTLVLITPIYNCVGGNTADSCSASGLNTIQTKTNVAATIAVISFYGLLASTIWYYVAKHKQKKS